MPLAGLIFFYCNIKIYSSKKFIIDLALVENKLTLDNIYCLKSLIAGKLIHKIKIILTPYYYFKKI